jgi:hypothetical protein
MTPKEKLQSIKRKMQLIQKNNPELDLKLISNKFFDIERYYKLRQEHFFLDFEINHCITCCKKI